MRIRLDGTLGTARIKLQIDVGFGDSVIPPAKVLDYPVLLDMPAPRVRGYSRESAIAEKFHAMAHRGLLNSRMRDYFDIWALSRQFEFDGRVVSRAIRATFDRRGLAIPARPVALRGEFASDTSKVAQWRGFLRKTRLSGAPDDLAVAVAQVRLFLGPVIASLAGGRPFTAVWRSPGPLGFEVMVGDRSVCPLMETIEGKRPGSSPTARHGLPSPITRIERNPTLLNAVHRG